MKNRWFIFILISIIFLQCYKKDSAKYISGYLFKTIWYDGDSSYTRSITVIDRNGFAMIPLVTLNQETLEISDYRTDWYDFGDDRIFPLAIDYKLEVLHSDGKAKSKVAMPGNFQITIPDTNFILNRDSALIIAWKRAEKASWYWLDYYVDYEFIDTTGEWDTYDFWNDTVVIDTFIRIEPNRLFPYYVMNLLEGEGEANVWAMDGPKIIPGSQGNITGKGYGFFHAVNEAPDIYFYVGMPTQSRRLYRKNTAREHLKNKLRTLVTPP